MSVYYIYVDSHLSSFLFIICDIVYVSDTALQCGLQELLKAIHTDVVFRVIDEY